jgi:PAS domain-containing protein
VTTATATNPPAARRRRTAGSGWHTPPLWVAVLISVAMIVTMATLRLVVFPQIVLPVGYGVPLAAFVWMRRRGLLWATAAAFAAISLTEIFWTAAAHAPPPHTTRMAAFEFALVALDLLLIAGAAHLLIVLRDRLERRNAELRQGNAQLAALNRELAVREEEVGRQNEELQSQTEELERQTEELRLANDELTDRERVTETLLSLSRGLTTELTRDEMIGRICDVLGDLLATPDTGAAILEQDRGVLRVACHVGFGPAGVRDAVLPTDRSFAALVLSRGRTAYVEDLRDRPDLVTPQPAAGEPFRAVLAAPLRALGWPVGTLEVYRAGPGPWPDEQVAIVESLAAQASISLEALRQLEQVSQERRRYETVLRAAPVGIAVCNHDCTDVRLNGAGAAMLGAPADANYLAEPVFAAAVTYHNGRVLPPEQWPLTRAAREGIDVHGMELEVALPTGRRLSLLTNATPSATAPASRRAR